MTFDKDIVDNIITNPIDHADELKKRAKFHLKLAHLYGTSSSGICLAEPDYVIGESFLKAAEILIGRVQNEP